jgi:hypothetical protein
MVPAGSCFAPGSPLLLKDFWMPQVPVRYSPSVEKREVDEFETNRQLVATLRGISETTYKDSGHALRSVHAKSHGLLDAELVVLDGLPQILAQGLFAKAGRYPVVMRFSTIPGDILADSVSVPRGLAIKVLNVEGDRLPGSENDATQDFLLVNGPAFAAPTAKAFLGNLELLAKTTDKSEGLKKVLSATLRGLETIIEAAGGESGTVKALGGHPETNILGETFYSQAAIRYGKYIAKVSVAPVSPELVVLTDASLNVNGKPDGLRDAVKGFFRKQRGVWELRAQLCTDLEAMPVEDASKPWPEDKSPYVAVARITALPQDAWSDANVKAIDGCMTFSPWHGLAAHQPLGSIMRVRKAAYEMSAGFRTERNGCPMQQARPLARITSA